MRQPSKLRYVQCELPDEVESAIIEFEDDFELSLKPFYDRLDDLLANELPLLQEELEDQIALREELVKGSPVQGLASLEAIDASTNLTSPKRDPNDPETKRIDERKMGAVGITLLNGRMFRTLAGHRPAALPNIGKKPIATSTGGRRRLVALRHLWEMSGGDYDAFVRLGTAVYTSPENSYTLFEFNSFEPEKNPYINKGFTFIDSIGKKNSQFRHRMIWTNNISASYALKSKMTTLGYDSTQINNIFSGQEPNVDYDYETSLDTVNTLISSVTRLVLLPENDPVRQPPWENEANYIELAIRRFLTYRTKKYTTSSVFDKEYWKVFLAELRPKDVKELLENRPEILDIELPQDLEAVTSLVERAIAMPSETTLINTYMNNLPVGDDIELEVTYSLYDLGLSIYTQLISLGTESFLLRAAALKELLLELVGGVELPNYFAPDVPINPQDVIDLFPTVNLPSMGVLMDSLKRMEHLVNAALRANSSILKFKKKNRSWGSNNVPSGAIQGFPTEETPAMILTRRVDWSTNFLDCSTSGHAIGAAAPQSTPPTWSPKEWTKEESVEDNEEWKKHYDNIAYLEARFGKDLNSVNDIRSEINTLVNEGSESGSINKRDTHITSKLQVINKSNDIKEVARKSTQLAKSIPTANKVDASEASLLSEYEAGEVRSAAMFAAKNRNVVEREEGKVSSGITTGDAKKMVESALGAELPFVGGSDKMLLPFTADVSVDLQICQNKYLKGIDDYLKGLLTLPKWLRNLIDVIKELIMMFQDKIDAFIIRIQTAMDTLFAKLEKLLTLDLNFSGKLGFENSLFKCSWGIDLGLKINLLDLLLLYLDRFLGVALTPFLKFIELLADFVSEVFCVPIRWIGEVLNGAAAALAELLAFIGCTVKDFKLPIEVFDLLNLILGTFSLRSLILKKGSADWLNMMGRINLGKNEFQGLSQFANICMKDNLSKSLSALQASMGLAVSDIPIKATSKGSDTPPAAVSSLIG